MYVTVNTPPRRRTRRWIAVALLLPITSACSGTDQEQRRATDTVDMARVTAGRRDSVHDSAGATCRSANLALSRVGADAGAGSRGVTYALTNVGPQPCTLEGHAGVALVDSTGQPLPGLRYDQTPAPDGAAGGSVTLEPDEQATFAIVFTGIPAGTLPCADAAAVRVTPPGATPRIPPDLRIAAALHVCGDRVRVTPLVPATAALIGRYRADESGSVEDAGARLLTLRLATGDSAVVETRRPGAPASTRSRGVWSVRDSVLVVRLDDGRPFSWIVGGGYLRPLAWDSAAYGARGTAMVRVGG